MLGADQEFSNDVAEGFEGLGKGNRIRLRCFWHGRGPGGCDCRGWLGLRRWRKFGLLRSGFGRRATRARQARSSARRKRRSFSNTPRSTRSAYGIPFPYQ